MRNDYEKKISKNSFTIITYNFLSNFKDINRGINK